MRLPSKTAAFWILLAASGLSAFVVPRAWTAWLRGFFQPLALIQTPLSWVPQGVQVTFEGVGEEPLPQNRARALLAENEALQRQVAQQHERLASAEETVAQLTRLKAEALDSQARVVIAPVVAFDANPRRATLLITLNERQRRFVQKDQWVLAATSPLPDWDPNATVRDLVDREWLVGRISEVQPRVARVQLTTDPAFKADVRAARVLPDGTWQVAGERCVASGWEGRELRISQVTEDYFKSGYRIAIVPAGHGLAAPMTVGQIMGAMPRDDSPQHFDLRVLPWGTAAQLAHVYVLASEP
jgi:cell shape-determining protein MreC